MGRFFVVCSLVMILTLMVISVIMPNDIIISLFSNSLGYLYLRAILVAFLLMQLLVPRRRQAWFVALSMTLSMLLIAWTIQLSLKSRMDLLDTLAFLESGIAIGIVTLELSTATFRQLIADYISGARAAKDVSTGMVAGIRSPARKANRLIIKPKQTLLKSS